LPTYHLPTYQWFEGSTLVGGQRALTVALRYVAILFLAGGCLAAKSRWISNPAAPNVIWGGNV
jgi:hypothetical protein